ncbi:hypothetical protein BKA70DRAFT_1294470 [Coprinopsis sp. MPI-PUGE-AT-0042]|nr:hypothetical protein BKA70DRAFT_1294470 [Coprinopsis sp. MPI-PUGE-AT-0042]
MMRPFLRLGESRLYLTPYQGLQAFGDFESDWPVKQREQSQRRQKDPVTNRPCVLFLFAVGLYPPQPAGNSKRVTIASRSVSPLAHRQIVSYYPTEAVAAHSGNLNSRCRLTGSSLGHMHGLSSQHCQTAMGAYFGGWAFIVSGPPFTRQVGEAMPFDRRSTSQINSGTVTVLVSFSPSLARESCEEAVSAPRPMTFFSVEDRSLRGSSIKETSERARREATR